MNRFKSYTEGVCKHCGRDIKARFKGRHKAGVCHQCKCKEFAHIKKNQDGAYISSEDVLAMLECADTRTMGREQLANDAVWQSLKAKMSKLETGKDVPEIRCPKCGSSNVGFANVYSKDNPHMSRWDVFCEDCSYEKNGFKTEKAARAAWRSRK